MKLRNQVHEDTYHIISFIWHSRKGKRRDGKRPMVARRKGRSWVGDYKGAAEGILRCGNSVRLYFSGLQNHCRW